MTYELKSSRNNNHSVNHQWFENYSIGYHLFRTTLAVKYYLSRLNSLNCDGCSGGAGGVLV